jgi:hypothetical protein
VIDEDNDQRYAPTKVESAIAFPFLVHPMLMASLLRACYFFTCSALVLNPPKNCARGIGFRTFTLSAMSVPIHGVNRFGSDPRLCHLNRRMNGDLVSSFL